MSSTRVWRNGQWPDSVVEAELRLTCNFFGLTWEQFRGSARRKGDITRKRHAILNHVKNSNPHNVMVCALSRITGFDRKSVQYALGRRWLPEPKPKQNRHGGRRMNAGSNFDPVRYLKQRAVIVIPVRIDSSRFANKPMVMIGNEPMIIHSVRQAQRTGLPVVIAACDFIISRYPTILGSTVVLTDPALKTGTDRVHAALRTIDPDHKFGIVINFQADMPTCDPRLILESTRPLQDQRHQVATVVAPLESDDEVKDFNTVKAVLSSGQLIDFTRNIIGYVGDRTRHRFAFRHHVGIYAMRRIALEHYVQLRPTKNEADRALEQMRFMDNGYSMGFVEAEFPPPSVNIPRDLKAFPGSLPARFCDLEGFGNFIGHRDINGA